MFGILLFAFGVMYTPGPVNILSLNMGAQKRFRSHIPFCFGVAVALAFWFVLIGYAGSAVVNDTLLPVIAGAGVCFILYLAGRMLTSRVEVSGESGTGVVLTFRDGLFMQLLNPKAMLVVLPVTTVQFPAAGIDGAGIAVWSAFLALLGFGAPMTYAAFGLYVSRHIGGAASLKFLNIIMGLMLIAVAADMGYHHVYPALSLH